MIVHADLELMHLSVDGSKDRNVVLPKVEKGILGLGRPLWRKHKLRTRANVPAVACLADQKAGHRIVGLHPGGTTLCVEQPITHHNAVDAPDGFSGRTQRSPTADP